MSDALPEIEIFRAGKLTDSRGVVRDFTADDLAKIANGYSADNPAPLCIGHPQDDTPAFGWVDKLRVDGEKLIATVKDAVPEFVAAVKRGAYRRISSALFDPAHGSNPLPGQFSLRHVAFLGGAAPAVPHLKPVQFANSDPDHVLTFEMEKVAADQVVPVNFISEEPAVAEPKDGVVDPAEFAAMQAENARLKTEADARKAADALAIKTADAEFVAGLVQGGRILPAIKDDVVALFGALKDEPIEFSADRKESPRDVLRKLLDKAQPQIVFSVISDGDATGPGSKNDPNALVFAAKKLVKDAEDAGGSLDFDTALERVTAGGN